MRGSEIAGIGTFIVFIGILVILAGIIKQAGEKELTTAGEEGAKSEIKGGGVILLGPFPVVFGTDKQSAAAVVILTIILMIALVFMRGRMA